jgi:hypothetical protein
MAEYFKNKIIGKLSEKPIIVKKITPQPKTETIIPIVEEPFIEPEIIIEEESPKEEIQISIESETISEEPVIIPNDTVITPEEPEVPLEEPTPKKSRKKKV